MATAESLSRGAGEQFRFSSQFVSEDAEQHRLRYHLLRLTVAGLTREEVADLGELARLAFQGSDVAEQAAKIKERADASPLAFAIADIVGQAGTRAAMLGTVLGAYAFLSDVPDMDKPSVAILGAVGGALAASGSQLAVDNVDRQAWSDYLRMDE